MSDGRLRELERRWKETRAVEDEAAYLLERVRVGKSLSWDTYIRLATIDAVAARDFLRLQRDRGVLRGSDLELAGQLGHEPARLASGIGPPQSEAVPTDSGQLYARISPLLKTRSLEALAIMAASRAALACREQVLSPTAAGASERVLLGVESWLHCPCEAHVDSIQRLLDTEEAMLTSAFHAAVTVLDGLSEESLITATLEHSGGVPAIWWAVREALLREALGGALGE
ncbi:hypothetical protein OAX78_04635 [Planctomycetota bacterium]|nr:hypothetical protein [Planctomycetota bacterium]